MKFDAPYRDLGPAEVSRLRDAILAQDEAAWTEFDHRQRAYDVHHHTLSIVLVFCDDAWPDVSVSRKPGWARLAEDAVPLMDAVVAAHFPPGGTILRAMAARLRAGGRIATHIDALPSFRAAHRIHAPITTGPGVRFTIDGKPCPMQVGRWYEINNQLPHSVMNLGTEDRINFIFDYLPPGAAT